MSCSFVQDIDARDIGLEEACLLLQKKLKQNALRPPRAKAASSSSSKGRKKPSAKKVAATEPGPAVTPAGIVLESDLLWFGLCLLHSLAQKGLMMHGIMRARCPAFCHMKRCLRCWCHTAVLFCSEQVSPMLHCTARGSAVAPYASRGRAVDCTWTALKLKPGMQATCLLLKQGNKPAPNPAELFVCMLCATG